MRAVLGDLRFGVRMLAKSPRFTCFAVVTLGLGIGINAAVFSFLDRALLRSLAVKKPHELAMVGYRTPSDSSRRVYSDFHHSLYVHYRDESQAFSGLLACTGDNVDLTIDEFPGRAMGAGVSANYFSVLGVRPMLGRALAPDDDMSGGSSVAVISHRLWQREFGGDPAVLGATVRMNGEPFTIVGVAPREFTGTYAGFSTAIYVPLHAWARVNGFSLDDRGRSWLTLLGRLRPGVTRDQAQANLAVLTEQLRRIEPLDRYSEIVLSSGSQGYSVWWDEGIWIALALFPIPAVLILVIACANVANMVLARATTRRKEIAIRLGLGAGRGAVIRQLLCEGLLMALLSGACGALIASWLSEALRSAVTLAVHVDVPGGVDGRILAFTALVSLASVFVFGLAPALRASRIDVVSMLKDGPGVVDVLSGRWSLRNALVIVQVAVSMIVLAFGALCIRSVRELCRVDAGFDPAGILAVSVDTKDRDGPNTNVRSFLEDLGVRITQWPGVQSVSLASGMPLCATSRQRTGVKEIEGFQITGGDEWGISLDRDMVSPEYFSMLGVPIVRGRPFSARDDFGGAPVLIVNDIFVQRFWPNEDPIGKRIVCGWNEVREVVGVVKTTRLWSLREKPAPTLYWPLAQSPETRPVLLIRTKADPKTLAPAVRKALSPLGLDPSEYDVCTIAERVSDLLVPQRMVGRGLNMLGLLGLMLAAAGIAAVMAYEVSRRTREIGIRVALGARRDAVLRLVLRRGLVLTGVGLGLGLSLSFIPAWLLCSLLPELRECNDYWLYGVRAWDPATYAIVSLVLTVVAMGASYLPARRAAGVDPMVALRYE